MIKINLLPHREEKRKQREKSFYALVVLGVVAGLLFVLVGGGVLEALIATQDQRNNILKQENKKLDEQIKEVASLNQEIQALKARQQAVEDLQADRNQPVYLMDELVLQTPEGIYLKTLKQNGQKVILNGYAQSNERVSEYLRNLGNNSPWLNRPDLVEIKAVTLGQGKDTKRIFEFTLNVDIKRPRDKEAASKGVVLTTPGGAQAAGAVPAPASAPVSAAKPTSASAAAAAASVPAVRPAAAKN